MCACQHGRLHPIRQQQATPNQGGWNALYAAAPYVPALDRSLSSVSLPCSIIFIPQSADAMKGAHFCLPAGLHNNWHLLKNASQQPYTTSRKNAIPLTYKRCPRHPTTLLNNLAFLTYIVTQWTPRRSAPTTTPHLTASRGE